MRYSTALNYDLRARQEVQHTPWAWARKYVILRLSLPISALSHFPALSSLLRAVGLRLALGENGNSSKSSNVTN